jgi:hypothetical protein
LTWTIRRIEQAFTLRDLLTTGSIPENRTQAHDATPIARRIRGGNLARKLMAHEEHING